MAAPSSPCGDPASAAGHQDVHGGVEAMASGGTGRWQQGTKVSGPPLIAAAADRNRRHPLELERAGSRPPACVPPGGRTGGPPGRVGISAWFWPAARIRQKIPTRQKMPFCGLPTDPAGRVAPVQNGDTTRAGARAIRLVGSGGTGPDAIGGRPVDLHNYAALYPIMDARFCRDERDCGRGFLSGVVWPAPGAAGAGSAPDVSPCFLCVVWLVRVRRAAWFLRVLQEMLVLRDIPEVPGRLMGDGRAVCP
jgi:hypothetical protein